MEKRFSLNFSLFIKHLAFEKQLRCMIVTNSNHTHLRSPKISFCTAMNVRFATPSKRKDRNEKTHTFKTSVLHTLRNLRSQWMDKRQWMDKNLRYQKILKVYIDTAPTAAKIVSDLGNYEAGKLNQGFIYRWEGKSLGDRMLFCLNQVYAEPLNPSSAIRLRSFSHNHQLMCHSTTWEGDGRRG